VLRTILEHEKEEVYKMEYKEWGKGQSFLSYIKDCREDDKRGERYVYTNEKGTIVSSFVLFPLHRLSKTLHHSVYGIAFVLTKSKHRNKGYAKKMINECIFSIKKQEKEASFLLHSEVNPMFYEKMNFRDLPYYLQKDESNVSMVFCSDEHFESIKQVDNQMIPLYF
jgi:predicted acetyltransferase